ncbi:MAG TPA: LPS export ABC transporter permease LptF [Nevskiaceae bacterium]|nr:LPS export ABC transporter permease LptF [Nevskiaceae bacterium]
MILNRYLLKEVFQAWLAITCVLLVIMVATRFASVLNFTAKGDISKDLLFSVVGFSSLRYLVILMPVSLLLAIMLALGRMYSENEIAAMAGCGVGLSALYRPIALLAILIALLTAWLAFQVGPWAGRQADFMVKDSRRLLQLNPFDPGHFQSLDKGQAIFYTASLSPDGKQLGEVFVQLRSKNGPPSTVVAASGTQQVNAQSGDRLVVLHDGARYLGQPGDADYAVAHFKRLLLRVAPPPFHYVNSQRQLASTATLLRSHDPADQAELQERISLPLSVLILALLAIPLSRLRPRQGRYSKVVAGVVIYLIYANLVGVVQTWIAKGHFSPRLGVWWIHALVLAIALFLVARSNGRLRWRRVRSRGATP